MTDREPRTVEVAGRPLACPVCGEGRFTVRRAALAGRALAFLDLEWAGRRATCYVCARCGHVQWFLPPARS